MKKVLLAAVMALSGCVSHVQPVQPVQQVKPVINFDKYSNLQLCKTVDYLELNKLSVNPASHPDYSDNLKHRDLIVAEIDKRNGRHIVNYCYHLKAKDLEDNLTPEQKKALELTPRQKAMQQYYTCRAISNYCVYPTTVQ